MKKQYQHIVPQVYLKQFGHQVKEFGKKWFVYAYDAKTNIWRNREIRRFLGENNLYDLDPNFSSFPRRLEIELHGGIESRLPKIVQYLDGLSSFTVEMKKDLAETTANFLCRSTVVLEWITGLLENNKIDEFWEVIATDNGIFKSKEKQSEILEIIKKISPKDQRNNLMLFYMLHVKLILINAHMTVYRNDSHYHLFTTDNPVTLDAPGFGVIIDPKMQMFFPLAKDILIHSYWSPDTLNLSSIRPIPNQIIPLNEEIYNHYTQNIQMKRFSRFAISPVSESELYDEEE